MKGGTESCMIQSHVFLKELLGFSVHTINVVVDSALNYSTITSEASVTGGL